MKEIRERKLEIINEYLNTPELERSLTKLGKKHNIRRQLIAKWLIEEGYEIINYQNRLRCDETVFDKIDTEEKAYWLGFLFADGNISSCGHRLEINLGAKDYDHLEKFRHFLKYEHPARLCKQSKKALSEYVSRLSLRNKRIWTSLYNLGCVPNKSLIAKFPYITPELLPHLIRGYCDGDGSLGVYIAKDGTHSCQICFTSGSIELLQYIDRYINLKSHYRKRLGESGNYTYWLSYRSLQARRVARLLYENATIYLDRKYSIYKEFCRLEQECSQMQSSKIGEGWNVNPEVISDITKGSEIP